MSAWTAHGSGDPAADGVVSVGRLEGLARARLDDDVWAYVGGGAGNGLALADATPAWRRHRLLPHSMVDVSGLSTSVSLLGADLPHPILVAPFAGHSSFHPGAEAETLRGAAAADSVLTISALGSTLAAEVGADARELDARWWMQVYLQHDRSLTWQYLDPAVEAGATALVLTVDSPSLGARDHDRRAADGFRAGMHHPNLAHLPITPDGGPPHLRVWNPHLANDVTPADITALRVRYGLPVLAKGILRPDDARRAVDAGAAAVIVSNHGARNLETAVSTAEALGPVVDAVGSVVPVLVDGGIRRGTDVATALCLGATAVLIGRPAIWGLTAYGASGVQHVIEVLRTELAMAMALLGAPTVADLTRDLLAR